MSKTDNKTYKRLKLAHALGLALLGMAGGTLFAQTAQGDSAAESADAAAADPQDDAKAKADDEQTELEEIVVSGYRGSIISATNAKRESVGFTDSVFAEDIGKFPDLNIAESLNRIPGIQLDRDVNGDGLNIGIRGLPNSFTRTILNGGQVATASIGLNRGNQNREVDLNLFPTEFFTQLTVNKSPKASLPEGGISGVVDMRSARPFDNPGSHFTYQLQGDYNDVSEEFSPRAAATYSWTNDKDNFGALVGISSVRGQIGVEGFETIGWTNPGLTYTQCGLTPPDGTPATNQPAACNVNGGGNLRIPDVVPVTAGGGLVPGTVIDRAFLLANNPGLTIDQISEALVPRLGRPVKMSGDRDRDAFLASFELLANDDMRFYLDTLYSEAQYSNDRVDVNLIGRNGNFIPLNMQVDENNVVTSATFTNAQFFLEARPYRDDVKYWNLNPGGSFLFRDGSIKLDVQANASRSWFFRESPTVLFNSPFTTLQYTNTGGVPTINSDIDLNDPNAGWTWTGGRIWAQNEKRVTRTKGARADLQFGDDANNLRIGASYDENERTIRAFNDTANLGDLSWQTYALSQVPQSALASYIRPGPTGFVTIDFDRFLSDTNYRQYRDNAPEGQSSSSVGATAGGFEEQTLASYIEFNGESEVFDRMLRFNAGVRYFDTDQTTSGLILVAGALQPASLDSSYDEFLPSFNLAWNVADDVVLRLAGSRTLTRPNPRSMLPTTNFSDISAQQVSQGNPDLTPYTSTNFDLGGEWYTGEEGFVGFTFFNKRIQGYTYQGNNTVPFLDLGIPFEQLNASQQAAINQRGGPGAATVTVTQEVNANATLEIQGWEAIWVQPLSFVVDGFGFQANYTHINLSTSGQDALRLATNVYGIAPTLWNGTLYWENYGASVRLSYNWTEGSQTSSANQNGIPYAYLASKDRGQLDLSASYVLESLPTKPQITLNVTNLTGEKLRTNFFYENAVYETYDPGTTFLIGIRGTF